MQSVINSQGWMDGWETDTIQILYATVIYLAGHEIYQLLSHIYPYKRNWKLKSEFKEYNTKQ